MFLLRMVFWVSVVALLLPAAPDGNSADAAAGAFGVEATAGNFEGKDAVAVAVATGADVMSFCDRNRGVCDLAERTGIHIYNQVTYYGARAFDWAYDAAVEAANGAPNGGAFTGRSV